jgi:MFS family permease
MNRDDVGLYSSAFLYSFSLGMASVVLPLIAVEANYTASQVGVLVAVSALTQIVMRWLLAAVMRRVSNATIVTFAGVSLGISNLLPVLSTALVPMVSSSLIQGISRACFWTGSQTHVVRRDRSATSAIAWLNLIASGAMIVAPVTAGVIAHGSNQLAFAVATGIALAGVVPTLMMERPPPFGAVHRMNRRAFIREPGVAMGVSANAVAGAWRGVLASYVPVALDAGGKSVVTIGAVVTVANAASIVGSFVVPRIPEARVRTALVVGSLLAVVTTTVYGFGELPAVVIAIALALGGLGVGVLQVLGVTVASSAVRRELRGDAVAVTGSLRALALFVSPIGIAALIPVLGLGAAVFVVSLTMLAPVSVIARAGRLKRS